MTKPDESSQGATPTPAAQTCPPVQALEQFSLHPSDGDDIAEHITRCSVCAAAIKQMREANDLLHEFISANSGELGVQTSSHADRLPGYELLEELYRGGQGVVYSARQLATKRIVAVKLLLQGAFATSKQLHRFEREIELVASLKHPNIVTLHDSGVAPSGDHFLVMELVEGERLDEAMDQRHHELRDALRLFQKMCDAIAYAHQRGVIHRDLKPANIIVDIADEPHILDFGVAKAVETTPEDRDSVTLAGEFVGSFAYAAPEQVTGEPDAIDTRTDVYALGVILYELLTQRRPYELTGSLANVVQTITNAAPALPSKLNSKLNDEIDAIVLRAIAKDPARRYQSAGALAEDVEHFLTGKPISAKRDSLLYVLRKYAGRRKLPITLASSLILLLIGYMITMPILYNRAERLREQAESALQALVEPLFEIDARQSNRPRLRSIEEYLLEIDEKALAAIGQHPELEARLRGALGLAFVDEPPYEKAIENLRAALRILQDLHNGAHAEIAETLHNLARAEYAAKYYQAAESHYRASIKMRSELGESETLAAATSTLHLASVLSRQERHDEAIELDEEALTMHERLLPSGHPDIAQCANNLGLHLLNAQRYEEAFERFRFSLDILRADLRSRNEDDNWGVGVTLSNQGRCLLEVGRPEEAEPTLRESLVIKIKWRGEDSASVALTRYYLARALLLLDKPAEAREQCIEAMRVQQLREQSESLEKSRILLNHIQAKVAAK